MKNISIVDLRDWYKSPFAVVPGVCLFTTVPTLDELVTSVSVPAGSNSVIESTCASLEGNDITNSLEVTEESSAVKDIGVDIGDDIAEHTDNAVDVEEPPMPDGTDELFVKQFLLQSPEKAMLLYVPYFFN